MKAIQRSPFEQRAVRDTDFAGRAPDVIIRELNIYAISPMVLFDAARLGPRTTISEAFASDFRFSLANWNLSLGYSWNPSRRPHKEAGAFTVSISVTDPFR